MVGSPAPLISHSLESLPGLEFSQTMSLAIGGLQPKVWAAAGLARKPQAAKRALPAKNLKEALARKAAAAERELLGRAVTELTSDARLVQGVAGCTIVIQSSPSRGLRCIPRTAPNGSDRTAKSSRFESFSRVGTHLDP